MPKGISSSDLDNGLGDCCCCCDDAFSSCWKILCCPCIYLLEKDDKDRYRKAEIYRKASETITKSRELSQSLHPQSDMRKLVDHLQEHLFENIHPGEHVEYDVSEKTVKKTRFIDRCLDAIIQRNVPELEHCLQEENIKQFKGFFNKTMYNIVKPFQFFSEKRRQEVIKGAPSLLPAIVQEIAEYDKEMHCDPDFFKDKTRIHGVDLDDFSRKKLDREEKQIVSLELSSYHRMT